MFVFAFPPNVELKQRIEQMFLVIDAKMLGCELVSDRDRMNLCRQIGGSFVGMS